MERRPDLCAVLHLPDTSRALILARRGVGRWPRARLHLEHDVPFLDRRMRTASLCATKLRWKGVWGRRRGQRVGDRMVVIETGAAKVGLARGRALLSASSAPAALPSPRSNLLRSNHASYPSVTCSPPLPTYPSVSPFPLNCPSRHLHSFHHPTVRCFSRRRFKDDLCSPSLSGAGGPDTPRRWPCL